MSAILHADDGTWCASFESCERRDVEHVKFEVIASGLPIVARCNTCSQEFVWLGKEGVPCYRDCRGRVLFLPAGKKAQSAPKPPMVEATEPPK